MTVKLKNYTGKKFYNGTALRDIGAPWNCVLSERSAGKSLWWVKEFVIDYFKQGHMFSYIRRYDEEVKTKNVNKYFEDTNFTDWLKAGTGYDGIMCERDTLYLFHYDDNGKMKKADKIGYVFAVNVQKKYKSLHYDGVYNHLFEEFITSGIGQGSGYLSNEFQEFNHLLSTVSRNHPFRVVMIGNTIGRDCPYLKEMGIDLYTTKPGKIYQNTLLQENGNKILCAFDYVDPLEKKSLFFGKAEKNIVKGQWDVNEVPHLWFKLQDSDLIYTCYFVCEELRNAYKIKVVFYDDQKYMYVYPYRYDDIPYVNGDIFSDTPDFEHKRFIHPEKKRHNRVRDLWRAGKVLYSDNLCGTEFRRAMKKYNPFI